MSTPIGMIAELQLGGTWTDISSYLYQRDTVTVNRGRQNEASTLQAGSQTATLNNQDARFTLRQPLGAYYPNLLQNVPARISIPASYAGLSCYLRMQTDDISGVSTPDSTALQITSGTLSVRIDCKITDWQQNHVLMAKWGATATAWLLYTNGDGTLGFYHYDGSASYLTTSTIPVPYYSGRIAIRVDYNISAQTVILYTAPSMSGSWTQLGATGKTTATAQSGGAGQAVTIGFGTTNLSGIYGEVYEAQILSTSTLKADPIFTSQTPGTTSFSDTQGNTWTLQGTSELTGKLYRFHGEWAASPKNADETNRDIYVQATSYGVNQRISNANTPLNSPMRRAYLRLPASYRLADYWAMEEGTNATSFGSAVGGSPMTFSGDPTLSSNSTFVCSAPLPVFNGASFTAPVRTNNVIWQDNVTRFLLSVPSGDDTNNAIIAKVYTTGTVALLQLVYGTGGVLTLQGFNSANTQLFSQGATFGLPELLNCRMSMELTSSGYYGLWVLTANGTTANGFSNTYSGSIGGVTQIIMGGGLINSAMGHLSVQAVDDGINDLINPLIGWVGETAGTRFARLCSEEGLNCRIMGPPETSVVMGVQTIDTLSDLLQQCENTDQGQQYEPRDTVALGYRTIRGMYNQPVMSSPSFVSSDLFAGFGSTADTQLTVNEVTASATDGSTARQTMSSGFPNLSKMNTNSPNSGWNPVSNSVTSGAASATIATTAIITAGTYTVKWLVSLAGTLGSGDANNFRLYLVLGSSSTLLATSVNADSAGNYAQTNVQVVVPAGGYTLVLKIGTTTPTIGSIYSGVIFGVDPGIGSVQTTTNPNHASDTELNSEANWTVHVRSVDDDRYPMIPFEISRSATPASIYLLDIGDYLQIPDGPTWLPNGPIKQLVAGFQEVYFPGGSGTIEINGIPEIPYEVMIAAGTTQRLASNGSYVSVAYTYGNTSLTVAQMPGSTSLWTTNPSDFPFVIIVAGMTLNVTNITGSTSPQVFTIGATSLNGVSSNLAIGTPVQVYSPTVVAL